MYVCDIIIYCFIREQDELVGYTHAFRTRA